MRRSKRIKQLEGMTFGRWKVIEYIGLDKKHESLWLCRCECGEERVLMNRNLKSGNTLSCGCLQREITSKNNRKDITGKKFCRLLAIESTNNKRNNSYLWKCLCDCGNIHFATVGELNSGNTKSCGCLAKENRRKTGMDKLIPNNGAAYNSLYYKYKKCAKKRNLYFDLTKEDFKKLLNGNCFYCDSTPKQVFKNSNRGENLLYNGIDRVDNRLGYSIDNCVSCCKICNTMKMQLSYEDFINHINKIRNITIQRGVQQ